MIYRILRKLLGRHVLLHLILPIVVGLGVEVLTEHFAGHRTWTESVRYVFSWQRVGFFGGVILTYLVIAFWLLYRETDIQIDPGDLAHLREELTSASRYFAVSVTKFREWFEPYTQVYFGEIVGRQLADHNFKHLRVVVLFNEAQLKDLRSDYLDGLHAKAFRDLHTHYKIPLGCLRPRDFQEILSQMNPADLVSLGCLPSPLSRLPARMRMWCVRRRRRIKSLAFALIDQAQKNAILVKFDKDGANVRLECSNDPKEVAAYAKLRQLIDDKALSGPDSFHPQYEFRNAFF